MSGASSFKNNLVNHFHVLGLPLEPFPTTEIGPSKIWGEISQPHLVASALQSPRRAQGWRGAIYGLREHSCQD